LDALPTAAPTAAPTASAEQASSPKSAYRLDGPTDGTLAAATDEDDGACHGAAPDGAAACSNRSSLTGRFAEEGW
jgi:hypothetical protein